MNSEQAHVDVCVLGDGLVGLSIALHLVRAGRSVAIVGKDNPGRASTAAVGMLTPTAEYDPWMREEFLRLLYAGREYYADFLASSRLFERVTYAATDFTILDLQERSEPLQSRMDYLPGLGFDCTWLEPWQVSQCEPSLTPTAFRGAIRARGDAVVNPIQLWEALRAEVAEAGVPLWSTGVSALEDAATGVIVHSGAQSLVAERVVIAAGAWSMEVGDLAGIQIPLCPVKGQVIQLIGEPNLINSVVFMPAGGCGSIVERSPGVYVVGTSEEYLEPGPSNTAGVVGSILSRLTTVLPGAADWEIDSMWSGFRPMTGDELPIIAVAEDPRFVIATGHHRNGVLLAPVTGRIVADLIEGGDGSLGLGLDLSPFSHGRDMRVHPRFADKY